MSNPTSEELLGANEPSPQDKERLKRRIIHGDQPGQQGDEAEPEPQALHVMARYHPAEATARTQFHEAADTFLYQLAQYMRKELPERDRNIMRILMEAVLDAWLRTKKEEGAL